MALPFIYSRKGNLSMACNCTTNRQKMLSDAEVDYMMSLTRSINPTAINDGFSIEPDNPLLLALMEEIKKKAQYLDEVGLEYLISHIRMYLSELGIRMRFVDKLPEKGDDRYIYFVPSTNIVQGANYFQEFVWLIDQQKWEKLGDFDASNIDWSGVCSKIRVNGVQFNVTDGLINLGNVVRQIKYNGVTKTVDATGLITLDNLGTSISLDGTTYTPDANGNIALDLSAYMKKSGGTFTGGVTIKNGSSNYGGKLNFGDGDYVHFYEDTDDHLEIYASKGIDLKTGNGYKVTINGTSIDTYISNAVDTGVMKIKVGNTTYSPNASGVATLTDGINSLIDDKISGIDIPSPDLSGYVKSVYINGSSKTPSSTGRATLGNYVQKIKVDDNTHTVGTSGLIDLTDDINGLIDTKLADFDGGGGGGSSSSSGVQKITMNGTTYNPNSAGTIALGGVCKKITLNGSTYTVSSSGTIALGTIEAGGGGNTVHTGTTVPAASLGENEDFYYQFA